MKKPYGLMPPTCREFQECCPTLLDTSATAFPALFAKVANLLPNCSKNNKKSIQQLWKIKVWRGSGRLLGDSWLQECCAALLDTSAAAFPALFGGILAGLGALWTAPGRILGHLGPSRAASWRSWWRPEALLAPSWGHVGGKMEPSWHKIAIQNGSYIKNARKLKNTSFSI